MRLVVAGPGARRRSARCSAGAALRRAGGLLALGSALAVRRHRRARGRARRQRQPRRGRRAARARAAAARRAARAACACCCLHRLGGVVHGGHARRSSPATSPSLPRERTRVVVLECVGGPELIVLEGEGMLRMRDYPPALRDWLAACGERAGHPLRRGLRSGFATDALIALKAGYPTARAGRRSTSTSSPPNYHSQRDVAANLDLGTVGRAVRGLPRGACGRSAASAAPAPA